MTQRDPLETSGIEDWDNSPSEQHKKDQPIFSVSEFHEMLNVHLARLGEIVIEGEISELKESQGKWLFITLKDSSATISIFGVMWELRNWRSLEVGMKVHVYGTARTYAKYGRLSVAASRIVPAGEGALKVAFERLKAQLEKEGLFDPSRKRELPQFPQRIGLITAKGSQAYNDFVKILEGRMGGIHVYFAPVSVQGDSAPDTICQALTYFNQAMPDLDALVVSRGGGSLEDLQAFNDEQVVRAIFASTIPVICGVGHEGDISLADMAADIRASTPSNAAEILVRERESVIQHIDMLLHRIDRVFTGELAEKKHVVDKALSRIEHQLTGHVETMKSAIEAFYRSVDGFEYSVSQAQEKRKHLVRLLESLDHHNVLKRGFSITTTSDGSIIRSIEDVAPDDTIATRVTDGTIYSHVKENKN